MTDLTDPTRDGGRSPLAAAAGIARRAVVSPVTVSIAAALLLGAVILAATGAAPLTAYQAILDSAFGSDGISDTLTKSIPIVGMAVALAIPLRAGLVNLGGDGQLVLGALAAAAVGLYSPFPAPVTVVCALLAGVVAGALWAALAAVLETVCGVPLLVSSLLLSYPAVSFVSYMVRFPLLQKGSGIPQSERLPDGVRLPEFAADGGLGTGVSIGILLIAAAAAVFAFVEARTAAGFELRMTGRGPRFAAYAGVDRPRLTLRLMSASGGLAGLVGAIVVLGFPYRLTDGALTTPGYTWTGLLAALLAAASPIGTVLAGFFFAALTVGGFGMEQETAVPQQLTQVLQALIILFLAVRTGVFAKGGRFRRRPAAPPPPTATAEDPAGDPADPAADPAPALGGR
ncbi:ABC transporter permease [Yinghuangia seranimata]|uniref:ABC transporter permease n=1 Tax=Yinghuangia seranimata TaxID=408067 RepID=UPI00248B95D5|nr:ABC transporter permease [Yinghuangia seranimata]MDI2125992.1 ABC transporter permease [Yinghuangia seranimata]